MDELINSLKHIQVALFGCEQFFGHLKKIGGTLGPVPLRVLSIG